jgi:hypothetical protein
MYDKTLKAFYRIKSDMSAYVALVPGTDYGNVTFLDNVVYYRINARAFAFSSSSSDLT